MVIALLDARRGHRDVKKSITVAYRNMMVIEEYLRGRGHEVDLMINPEDINLRKRYDVIVCGFASFVSEINRSRELLNRNPEARVFWLVGEYEQIYGQFPALVYTKRKFEMITNFTHSGMKEIKNATAQHYCNINTFIAREPNEPVRKKYGCIYYGRWRPDRTIYFGKYLQKPLYLSTSAKNMKRFKHAGCNPHFLNPLSWRPKGETLNLFKYQLYIEDVFTHNNFNSLANRFYEAGVCRNVIFFDVNTRGTVEKSELREYITEVNDYFVGSHEELTEKMDWVNKDFNLHLEKQSRWHEKARRESVNP